MILAPIILMMQVFMMKMTMIYLLMVKMMNYKYFACMCVVNPSHLGGAHSLYRFLGPQIFFSNLNQNLL